MALPGGASRVFDFSVKPVHDDAGAVVQVVAEGRDITELKRTEATLRQSQKLETSASSPAASRMTSTTFSWP